MLYVDTYQIRDFSQVMFNQEAAKQLKSIARSDRDRIPHLIIQGPSGSGRETLLNLYLQEVFDKSIWSTKSDVEVIDKKEYPLIHSKYHWVLDFSMCGHDRAIITSRINQVIEYPVADAPYRVIVIRHAENLTRRAQEALKRIMETKVADARLILLSDSLYTFDSAFASRCTTIRVGAPTNQELTKIINKISAAEHIKIHDHAVKTLVEHGDRHLTNVLTAFQYLCTVHPLELHKHDMSESLIVGSFHSKKYLHDHIFSTIRSKSLLNTRTVMLNALDLLCIHKGNYHEVIWETYQNLQHWVIRFSEAKDFDCARDLYQLLELTMDCNYKIRYHNNMKKIQLDRFTVHVVQWIEKMFQKGGFHRNQKVQRTAVLKK